MSFFTKSNEGSRRREFVRAVVLGSILMIVALIIGYGVVQTIPNQPYAQNHTVRS